MFQRRLRDTGSYWEFLQRLGVIEGAEGSGVTGGTGSYWDLLRELGALGVSEGFIGGTDHWRN